MWKRIIGSTLCALVISGCSAGLSSGASFGGTGGGGSSREQTAPPTMGGQGDWTLAERQYWTKLQEELDALAKKVNDHCHSRISASYVQDSFRGMFTAGGSYGLEVNVRTTATSSLFAILDVCTESDMHKQAVATNIRHVAIAFGPAQYTLDGGTFHATINVDDDQVSTYQRAMVAVLKDSL